MKQLFALCLLGWLLPLAVGAQLFNKPEPGTYVLREDRPVARTGQLRLRKSGELQVQDAAGQTTLFKPAQVLRFSLGNRRFVVVGGFFSGGGRVEDMFAQQLDSGKVLLLRCFYPRPEAGGTMMGANGMMMTPMPVGGGGSNYVLQHPGQHDAVEVPPNGYQLSMMLEPFFRSRPDLVKLLAQNRITRRNLPEAVRAFNQGLPFNPPPAPVD